MPIQLFGASVTGPAHQRAGQANQDAWGHARVRDHRVVVVADGLGSRPHAAQGARAACRAVPEALGRWLRHPHAPVEVLLGLVHLLWRARLAPLEPADAASTCLFAVLDVRGAGMVAQLGDGLVLVQDDEGTRALWQRPADDFSNRTLALGASPRIAAWRFQELEPGHRSVVLCSDGVADDLLPEKLDAFAAWLRDDLLPMEPAVRWRALARELRAWPTPRHSDDKTIAFIRSTP